MTYSVADVTYSTPSPSTGRHHMKDAKKSAQMEVCISPHNPSKLTLVFHKAKTNQLDEKHSTTSFFFPHIVN